MATQGTKGIERIIKATGYSWQGLRAAYRYEAAFRQEIFLAIILVPLGIWLGQTGLEKAILVSSVILVLIVELLNSGLEVIVDRIGDEQHKLSGRAKELFEELAEELDGDAPKGPRKGGFLSGLFGGD